MLLGGSDAPVRRVEDSEKSVHGRVQLRDALLGVLLCGVIALSVAVIDQRRSHSDEMSTLVRG